MSKLVEIDLRVNENIFTSIAQKLGWVCEGNTLSKYGMFRKLVIKNGKLIYDDMDTKEVKNLIGYYIAEITGGTVVHKGQDVYVEVYR